MSPFLLITARSPHELNTRVVKALAAPEDGDLADAEARYRLAIFFRTPEERRAKLEKAARAAPTEISRPPRVAFLFTGQGAQYSGMARRLFEASETFAAFLRHAEQVLGDTLDCPLTALFFAPENAERLNETRYTQPALLALEYALAALWRELGVTPELAIGHSVGEYAAAALFGVWTLPEALRLISARARLMQALPKNGEMAAVFAGATVVHAALLGEEHAVSIAAYNAPENTVISGARDAVLRVLEKLKAQGIKSQPLSVSHAFHSPLMQQILPDFRRVMQSAVFGAPAPGVVSNLTGALATAAALTDPEYWVRHVREPVHFAQSVQRAVAAGVDVFVEVGPSATLTALAQRCVDVSGLGWFYSLRKKHDDIEGLAETLCGLYMRGVEIDWPRAERLFSQS